MQVANWNEKKMILRKYASNNRGVALSARTKEGRTIMVKRTQGERMRISKAVAEKK